MSEPTGNPPRSPENKSFAAAARELAQIKADTDRLFDIAKMQMNPQQAGMIKRRLSQISSDPRTAVAEYRNISAELVAAQTSIEAASAETPDVPEQKSDAELVLESSTLHRDVNTLLTAIDSGARRLFEDRSRAVPEDTKDAIPYLQQLKADLEAAVAQQPAQEASSTLRTDDTDPPAPIAPEGAIDAEHLAQQNEALLGRLQKVQTPAARELWQKLQDTGIEAILAETSEDKEKILQEIHDTLRSFFDTDAPKFSEEMERAHFALLNNFLHVRHQLEQLPNSEAYIKRLNALIQRESTDDPKLFGQSILRTEEAILGDAEIQQRMQEASQQQRALYQAELHPTLKLIQERFPTKQKNHAEKIQQLYEQAFTLPNLFDRLAELRKIETENAFKWDSVFAPVLKGLSKQAEKYKTQAPDETRGNFDALQRDLEELQGKMRPSPDGSGEPWPLSMYTTKIVELSGILKQNMQYAEKVKVDIQHGIERVMKQAELAAGTKEWVNIQGPEDIPDLTQFVARIIFFEGSEQEETYVFAADTLAQARALIHQKGAELKEAGVLEEVPTRVMVSENLSTISTKSGKFGKFAEQVFHPIQEAENMPPLKGEYANVREGDTALLHSELEKLGWRVIAPDLQRSIERGTLVPGGLMPDTYITTATYKVGDEPPIRVAAVYSEAAVEAPSINVQGKTIQPHQSKMYRSYSVYDVKQSGTTKQHIQFEDIANPTPHEIALKDGEKEPLETFLMRKKWLRITPAVLTSWQRNVPQVSISSDTRRTRQFPTVWKFVHPTTHEVLLFTRESNQQNATNPLLGASQDIPASIWQDTLKGFDVTIYHSVIDPDSGAVHLEEETTVQASQTGITESALVIPDSLAHAIPEAHEAAATEADFVPTSPKKVEVHAESAPEKKQRGLIGRLFEKIKKKHGFLIKTLAWSIALSALMKQDSEPYRPADNAPRAAVTQMKRAETPKAPDAAKPTAADANVTTELPAGVPETAPQDAGVPEAAPIVNAAPGKDPLDALVPLEAELPPLDAATPETPAPLPVPEIVTDTDPLEPEPAAPVEVTEAKKEKSTKSYHEITVKKGEGIRLAAIKYLTREIVRLPDMTPKAAHEQAVDAVLHAVIMRRLEGKSELNDIRVLPGFEYSIYADIQKNGATSFEFIMPEERVDRLVEIAEEAESEQKAETEIEETQAEAETEVASLELREGESISVGDVTYYISPKTGKALRLVVFNIANGIVQFARPARPHSPWFAAKDSTVKARAFSAHGMEKHKQFLSKDIAENQGEVILTAGGNPIRCITEYIAEKTGLTKDQIRADITVDLLIAGVPHETMPGKIFRLKFDKIGEGGNASATVELL
ncbi:MAG: hypothetical protein HOE53_00890 [Candidatus Magasanikbacteria bacterium]|jgi:hypothetical protein|nr:hypothetical protein [Candidatus Magasanikbacteria bacterium]